jgi:hypothetical protein
VYEHKVTHCVKLREVVFVGERYNYESGNMTERFEVFTAVNMKSGVFWDVTPCDSFKNRRFGGTSRLCHHEVKNR